MDDLEATSPRRRWLALLGILPLLQACSPLRLINATVPGDTHERRDGLAYGPLERQQLDLYLPRPARAAAPMVVFFYGGSWTSGRREDYRFVGEALASRGVVVAVADYRLSPQVRYPAFLEDSALAVSWAISQAEDWGVDRHRIYLMGHSAGAYNAAMLALDRRWLSRHDSEPAALAGWIGLAGPYDFLPIALPDVQRAFNWPSTPADSQPLHHARHPERPLQPHRVLLMAAQEDRLVDPQRNTLAMAEALKERGLAVQTELLDGVGHATLIGALAPPLRGLAPVLDRVADFLQPAGG